MNEGEGARKREREGEQRLNGRNKAKYRRSNKRDDRNGTNYTVIKHRLISSGLNCGENDVNGTN
jgi:hypothetical protein